MATQLDVNNAAKAALFELYRRVSQSEKETYTKEELLTLIADESDRYPTTQIA